MIQSIAALVILEFNKGKKVVAVLPAMYFCLWLLVGNASDLASQEIVFAVASEILSPLFALLWGVSSGASLNQRGDLLAEEPLPVSARNRGASVVFAGALWTAAVVLVNGFVLWKMFGVDSMALRSAASNTAASVNEVRWIGSLSLLSRTFYISVVAFSVGVLGGFLFRSGLLATLLAGALWYVPALWWIYPSGAWSLHLWGWFLAYILVNLLYSAIYLTAAAMGLEWLLRRRRW